MGMILPILFVIAAAAASCWAVYVAITTLYILAIILAIVAVSATLASIYFYCQGDIKNAMLFAAIGITAGIGGVYLSAANDMATAQLLANEGTAEAIAASDAAMASSAVQSWGYITSIYEGFQVFAEAIHLKTLLEIHQIAYLVSSDYRTMLSSVMESISKYSEAMGYGSAFMYLALRDTRNIVMDASSMIGNKYDMAEVTWLSSLGEYLKTISTKGTEYYERPEAFIWDLDQSLHRPSVDLMGETTRSIYAALGSVVSGLKTGVENAKILERDLKRLVADLPAVITKSFKPDLDKVFAKMDKFITLTYDPAMALVTKAFDAVGKQIEERKQETKAITARLVRPGNYIKEIDDLPEDQRFEDEQTLAAVAARGGLSQFEEFETGMVQMRNAMEDRIKEEEVKKPPPLPEEITVGIPRIPKGKKPKTYKGPFVGEY